MNTDILITFSLATLALAVSPGPDNIFVMMQSMVHGKKYGLATVAGLMTGCIIHTTLVAFGISELIKRSEYLFFGIKLLGALYLLYLAYKVFQSNSNIDLDQNEIPKKSVLELFKQGFLMNVLNPKVTIFFLAFFPGFLFSTTLSSVVQFYVLGFLFIVISFLVFGAIAVLAGYISSYIKTNTAIGKVLKWLQIIVFVGIGVFILFSEK